LIIKENDLAMEPKKENEKAPAKNVAKIKVAKNGPYLISGGIPLQKQVIIADSEGTATQWQPSTKYPPQEKCSLCRCRQSKNKPFCYGTHSKVGFDGAETAGEEAYLNQPKEIDGPTLKLIDTEKLCASARFCHRAGGIWNLVPKSDDPETKQITIEEACDCPSGRLVVTDKQAKKIIEANLKNPLG
jgi:CDGSH-type Zn-finger protein